MRREGVREGGGMEGERGGRMVHERRGREDGEGRQQTSECGKGTSGSRTLDFLLSHNLKNARAIIQHTLY